MRLKEKNTLVEVLPVDDVRWQKWLRATLRQLLLQVTLILVGITVIFPILWIVTLATDARGLPQYSELNIIPNPERLTLNAFEDLIFEPFSTLSSANNEIYFTQLLSNSLFVALGTAMLSVGLGASAAYAFSRFRFIGRQGGMLGFILLLMMPATGTIVPLIAIFSLLQIHVVVSAVAPALFYGVIAALVTLGIARFVRSLVTHPLFQGSSLRWLGLGSSILLVFGLIYLGWAMLFHQSEAYDEHIRQPLRQTNTIEDEILSIQSSIPRTQDNIARQQRRLEDAQVERQAAEDQLAALAAQWPEAYALSDALSSLTLTLADATTAQPPSPLLAVYPATRVRDVILLGLDGEVVNQQLRVGAAEAEAVQLQHDLTATEAELEAARAPYIEVRNTALARLVPYVLATFGWAALIAFLLWIAIGLPQMPANSLMRRDRFNVAQWMGYGVIILIVSYLWFTANYESPTKQAGLKDGGLWYDIRISFRDEDEIRDELEPYLERDSLEASRVAIQEMGIDEFRTDRQTTLEGLAELIADVRAVDVSLNPPDNLTRREEIDWRDNRRRTIRQELSTLQTQAREYVGLLTRLNLLNNENFKNEMLDILEDRRAELQQELRLSDAPDLEAAVANFSAAIQRLPGDDAEQERLTKELAVRSSNDGNVTETMKITLFGLMIAYTSSALPFAIWNLKGYFDTIPKELEEAALVDGANLVSSFVRIILPLSLPALAITMLFGFMTGWTEFILAVQFLTAGDVDRTTLAMALRGIAGGGATQAEPNYTEFAAMSILMAIPVVSLFYLFQRWIVSGLTVGGVKG